MHTNAFMLAEANQGNPVLGLLLLGGIIWALVAIGKALNKPKPSYDVDVRGTIKPR